MDAISLRSGVYGRGWLPATAQMMAHLVQQGTAREAEATARQSGRLPYSRVSFDRVTHEVGDHWQRHHADIEDRLIQELEIPHGAVKVHPTRAVRSRQDTARRGNAWFDGEAAAN